MQHCSSLQRGGEDLLLCDVVETAWDKPRTDMLTYGDEKKREAFRVAIEQAREDGLSPAEMASMITAAENGTHPANGVHRKETDDVIYEPGELPDGLIDLPSASKKYGIPGSTLRNWIRRGKLAAEGRLRAPAAGGGYVVVSQAGIEYCRDHPRKTGRKKRATP